MARIRPEARRRTHRGLADVAEFTSKDELAAYVLRHAVAHALGARDLSTAARLATSFDFLVRRLARFGGEQSRSLVQEVRAVGESGSAEGASWYRFINGVVHLLARGDDHWDSGRILLQLASESTPGEPWALAAETWLASGAADGLLWLRSTTRRQPVVDDAVSVLESPGGHAWYEHVAAVRGGRLLAWSRQSMVRWDLESGQAEAARPGASHAVALPSGVVFLAASDRAAICRWDSEADETSLCLLSSEEEEALEGVVTRLVAIDDHRVVAWSDDPDVNPTVFDEDGSPVGCFDGHHYPVADLVPLGDLVATYGDDRFVCLWDSATGREVARLEGHRKGVRGLVGLDDGTLLTWSMDYSVRRWDRSGTLLATCLGFARRPDGATMQEGHLLAWGSDKTVRVWASDGEPLAAFSGHGGAIYGVHHLGRDHVVSHSADHTIRVWSLSTGSCVHTWKERRAYRVWVVSEDHLVSWGAAGRLRVWQLGQDTCLDSMHSSAERLEVLDEQSLRVLGSDGRWLMWRFGQPPEPWKEGEPGTWVAQLADGRQVSVEDGTLRVWRPREPGREDDEPAVVRLPEGMTVVQRGRSLHLLDAAGRQKAKVAPHGKSFRTWKITRERLLTWCEKDGEGALWNPATLECQQRFDAHAIRERPAEPDWFEDGLAYGLPFAEFDFEEFDGDIFDARTADGALFRTVQGPRGGLVAMAGPLLTSRFLVAFADDEVVVWTHDLDEVSRFSVPGEEIDAVTILDEERLLTVGERLCVWEMATGRCLERVPADEALYQRPDLWLAEREGRTRRNGDVVTASEGKKVVVRVGLGVGGPVAVWHADEVVHPVCVLDCGVVLTDAGPLELMNGGSRAGLGGEAPV